MAGRARLFTRARCEQCGKGFEKKSGRQIYCGDACRTQALERRKKDQLFDVDKRTGLSPLEVAGDVLDPVAVFRYARMTPDPWQAEELRRWWASTEHLAVVAPRRRGKTAMAAALVAHGLLWIPDFQSLVAGPTERHGVEFVRQVKAYYLAAPEGIRPNLVGEAAGKLEVTGGGRLVACTANPSSLRGLGADVAVLDEGCYLSPPLLEACWPTMLERRGRMIAVSTPSAGNSWLRDVFEENEGQGVAKGWRRRYVRPEDSARFDPDRVEAMRGAMSESAFAREYGGVWEDGDLGVGEALSPFNLAGDDVDDADVIAGQFQAILRKRGYR